MLLDRLSPRALLVAALVAGLSFQLLLGTSYVAAFLDPVAASTGLPVGVVNLDEGPHGAAFLDVLRAADSPITWVSFPSREALADALVHKEAFGGLIVSRNFSAALDSLGGGTPYAATVETFTNPGASATGAVAAQRALDAALDGLVRQVQARAIASFEIATTGLGAISLDQARVLAEPVKVSATRINDVPARGASGLAPTYLAMAAWVGGYIGSAALERFRERTRISVAKRSLFVAGAAMGQAIVATFMLRAIGLDVPNFVTLAIVLAAGTWMAYTLVSLCLDIFGLAGIVPAFAILSFGLPASGAIYPLAMLPSLYQSLHAIDPFTWLVEGLRTALHTPHAGDLGGNVARLVFTALGATGVSLAIAGVRGMWRRRHRADVHSDADAFSDGST